MLIYIIIYIASYVWGSQVAPAPLLLIYEDYRHTEKIMEKEIWKDIKGFEGYYQISNYGNVKGLTRKVKKWDGEKIIKEKIKIADLTKGYYRIALYKKNKIKKEQIHRLVATHFILNPENKPQVNHIDGNKLNNHVSNLEWVTQSENQIHAYKIGLQKKPILYCENHNRTNLKNKDVINIRKKYKPYKYTMKMLAKEYNLSVYGIAQIIYRYSWRRI